jgi:hypothetical protein
MRGYLYTPRPVDRGLFLALSWGREGVGSLEMRHRLLGRYRGLLGRAAVGRIFCLCMWYFDWAGTPSVCAPYSAPRPKEIYVFGIDCA